MEETERQIEEYTARHRKPEQPEQPAKKDAEEKVEEKARQADGPTPTSVVQKRSYLSDVQLNKRIDQIASKHVGKIDEGVLRGGVAYHLKKHNNQITEADLVQLQDDLLKANETEKPEQHEDQPLVKPNVPFWTDAAGQMGNGARRVTDWASAAKTPGGIGLLVFILLFFIWVVVPVNDSNQTRLQLLWGILTGQVGWSQSIKDQETNLYQQAAQQSGIPGLLPNVGGGGATPVSVPVEVTTPFVPDFGD